MATYDIQKPADYRDQLADEIIAAAPVGLVEQIDWFDGEITVNGVVTQSVETFFRVYTTRNLTQGEKSALQNIVANHDPSIYDAKNTRYDNAKSYLKTNFSDIDTMSAAELRTYIKNIVKVLREVEAE